MQTFENVKEYMENPTPLGENGLPTLVEPAGSPTRPQAEWGSRLAPPRWEVRSPPGGQGSSFYPRTIDFLYLNMENIEAK